MCKRAASPLSSCKHASKKAKEASGSPESPSTDVPSSPVSVPVSMPVSMPVSAPAPIPSFGSQMDAVSGFTPEMMAVQMQFFAQMQAFAQSWHQQQQQQQPEPEQPQREQPYAPAAEINTIKKECSDFIADHYREHMAGRGIQFDIQKSITDKGNRKIKNLLRDEVRKYTRYDGLTDSQIFTMIRSKFYYMVDKANGKVVVTPTSSCRSRVNAKLLKRRTAYHANAAAYHARYPFAEKILTVDWTSDEEDGPEDEDGRTFLVKRPSFRSNKVVEFHKELQKELKDLLKKKGAPPTVRRRVEYVEKEFPDKLDHEYYPSWAFSSPDLGFPVSVSGSSSSDAANPMP